MCPCVRLPTAADSVHRQTRAQEVTQSGSLDDESRVSLGVDALRFTGHIGDLPFSVYEF